MSRRHLAALSVLLVLLAAGAYAWLRMLRDSSEPVGVSEAVTEFRDRVGSGARGSPPGFPAFGVYAYEIRGGESLDAVVDSSRRYDGTATIAIEPAGCGVSERWQVSTTRWSEARICPADPRRRLAGVVEYHEFFGVAGEDAYGCDGDRPPPLAALAAGARWRVVCGGSAGALTLRSRLVASPEVSWAGRVLDAVRIRTTTDVSGESEGRSTQVDLRRRSDGLLLERSVRTGVEVAALGGGNYEEAYVLRLVSTRPRR